jgi:hypothetical protein
MADVLVEIDDLHKYFGKLKVLKGIDIKGTTKKWYAFWFLRALGRAPCCAASTGWRNQRAARQR